MRILSRIPFVLTAAAFALGLAACKPEPPPPPAGSDTMGPKAPPPGALVLVDTTVTREDTVMNFSLTFPRADGPGGDAVNAAYDSTVARVVATLTATVHDLAAMRAETAPGDPSTSGPAASGAGIDPATGAPGAGATLEGRTEEPTITANLYSARTTYSEYTAGAAHPATGAFVVNVDRRSGRALALADLFAPGTPYLDTLAARTRADLKTQLEGKSGGIEIDTEMLTAGTAPTAASFALFTLGVDGLHVYFPPYAVAPYVFGDFESVVPWEALRPMLRENSAASGL